MPLAFSTDRFDITFIATKQTLIVSPHTVYEIFWDKKYNTLNLTGTYQGKSVEWNPFNGGFYSKLESSGFFLVPAEG